MRLILGATVVRVRLDRKATSAGDTASTIVADVLARVPVAREVQRR